jgi:hypothetical protein
MTSPLICPKCGAAMNRHASKIVPAADETTAEHEAVLDIHTCPGCGASESTSG